MPKVRHQKTAGVLGKKPHPYHRHWQFTYSESETGYQDILDNDNLEECSYKNQIKIMKGSVLLYIGEGATSVDVDLYLPTQVTMVVIHKYGQGGQCFCFATVGGAENCSAYPGCQLRKNPHSRRLH